MTPLFQVFILVVVAFLCGASLGCMRFETIGETKTPVELEPLDPSTYCDCPACPEGETLDARIVNARCWCGCVTEDSGS